MVKGNIQVLQINYSSINQLQFKQLTSIFFSKLRWAYN